MGRPDATALAALDLEYIKPAFFCFLDIVGDPVRATTWPANVTFPVVSGQTFSAVDPDFVDISEVKNQEGGSETVTASVSGLLLPDNELLNLIGDPANWRGRVARLWLGLYNEQNVQQGAVWNYYTGRMVSLEIRAAPDSQTIQISIENYLAALGGASNRTYLDQQLYDPDDLSAAAKIMAANGVKKAGQTQQQAIVAAAAARGGFVGSAAAAILNK
jgi:hypothetical protein